MAGIQGIKRAITAPHFKSGDPEKELSVIEHSYFQLAQQVNAIQSQFQVFKATWAAAVSPQTITLAIPLASIEYAVFAGPSVNVGHWWITARTKTTFDFNMSAAAAANSWFLVMVGT